jgi:hypothetical protein
MVKRVAGVMVARVELGGTEVAGSDMSQESDTKVERA